MTFLRVALQGLKYHWRIHLTVALGVAAATAVLTGALLVGDSVRGSLRDLTLDRLGPVSDVLIADRFFRTELADEVAGDQTFSSQYDKLAALILMSQSTVERSGPGGSSRVADVLVVGSGPERPSARTVSFWELADPVDRPNKLPGEGEVVLNREVADQLNAKIGDRVTVRLSKPQDIPADSPLGEKTNRIGSLPGLEVIDIIETRGPGRLSLFPSPAAPRNAYLSLDQLQSALKQSGRVNSLFAATASRFDVPPVESTAAINQLVHPTLSDLGLKVKHVRLAFSPPDTGESSVLYDYCSITSERMILEPQVLAAAERGFSGRRGVPVLTYLANRMEKVGAAGDESRSVPYSMVSAIDLSDTFPLGDAAGKRIRSLTDHEIVLTSWAAQQLNVGPGDQVALTYFAPETAYGRATEQTIELTVKAVTPLTKPAAPYLPSRTARFSERPTLANDPDLTPEVSGITDQRSIDAWEVPFEIDYRRITSADDAYWAQYATTPKAYVSTALGSRLWGSRFGRATSYRVPVGEGMAVADVEQRLLDQLRTGGNLPAFQFVPIKARQLAASSGNTPFDVLFLMLSFFIIVAALLLVGLLFRLGFEQRAAQTGLLLALGWRRRRAGRLLMFEGTCVSAVGAAMGSGLGVGYAWLMLAGLRSESWWLGAVGTPFLTYHSSARSLAIGYVSGLIVCSLTIAGSLRLVRRISARRLLAGQTDDDLQRSFASVRWVTWIVPFLLVAALLLALTATGLAGEAQAGAFVGGGALVLVACLLGIWSQLRAGGRQVSLIAGRARLLKLALRSAARNPSRSTLTIALIATASFLIVAMSAFQLKPSTEGTGGFPLMARSSQPVLNDLNSDDGRDELLADRARLPAGTQVYSLRVRPGDNASCGNLYRAARPRVLGIPEQLIDAFDDPGSLRFGWAKSAATKVADRANPWRLLNGERGPEDAAVPVVIDKDTAMYSLQLYGGVGSEFTIEYAEGPVTFRVVGLLSTCILHGNLVISERDFQRLFPAISGYRQFLIRAPEGASESAARVLEDDLSDFGFDVTPSGSLLSDLLAVQNTYLRTFQALGALGMLLGTFGLAAVQFRSILERRGEMGLLRATGYGRAQLRSLVLLENLLLLFGGLAAGTVSALVAVLPHMWQGGARLPVADLAVMFLVILIVGLGAGLLAATATLRVPLLAALRDER